MKSYVIAGLGRFGKFAAMRLCELGNEVLVIEQSSDLVQQIAGYVTHAVVADSKDKEVLRSLGVQNFDCAIVSIGSDLAASVLTTMNFKELGLPMVICKAQDETHARVLEKVGADRVVIPERESANKLAQGLSCANVLEYIELSPDYGITEVAIPWTWVGKNLRQLNIRARLNVNVLAVRSEGEDIIVAPGADYTFQSQDSILALGEYKHLAALENL